MQTKMNQDNSRFTGSCENQIKRTRRNNLQTYNKMNIGLEDDLKNIVHIPTGRTASYDISDFNKGMVQAALFDASVGGTANGLRDTRIADNIKVNRVIPSDEWYQTVLKSTDEADVMPWFTSSVSQQLNLLHAMNVIPKKGLLIAIDKHLIPRYDRTRGPELLRSKPKNGTKYFECYITAQCVNDGIRLNLAVQRVPALVSGPEAVGGILDSLLLLGVKIRAVLLDREFFALHTIQECKKRGIGFIIPAKNTPSVKESLNEFSEGKREQISEQIIKGVDGKESYFLSIKKRTQQVKKKTTNMVTPEDTYIGFAISDPAIDPDIYFARWGIETGYAKLESMRAKTRSRKVDARVFCFVYSILLFNIWVLINAINRCMVNQTSNTQLSFKFMLLFRTLDNSSKSKPPPPSRQSLSVTDI